MQPSTKSGLLLLLFCTLSACGGGSGNETKPVTTPTAAAASAVTNLTVQFDASSSTDIGGTITSYSWDFGDGSAAGSGVKTSHVYAAEGSYTAVLTVTDSGGVTATKELPLVLVAPVLDASKWAWIQGTKQIGISLFNVASVRTTEYGTLGVASPDNMPGGRESASTWTDASGQLWMFGGYRAPRHEYDYGYSGYLNDLWRFDPVSGQWTWVSGSNTITGEGVYGTQGVASAANQPSARWGAASWKDASGKLWLFGGDMYSYSDSNYRDFNDLWQFDPVTGQWTWINGSSSKDAAGVYGTKGVAAPSNQPGARYFSTTWTDVAGNFWLLGGVGFDTNGNKLRLNDLWKFDPNTRLWTWVSGSSTGDAAAVYGTQGVAAAGNQPEPCAGAAGWTDASGNLWLFGGASGNVLWKFDPAISQWTWVKGSVAGDTVYGTQGIAAAANQPGKRAYATSWSDAAGNFWLFSGYVGPTASQPSQSLTLNELWKFNPGTGLWTWVNGADSRTIGATYGQAGVPAMTNLPSPNYSAMSWMTPSGKLWFYGGHRPVDSKGTITRSIDDLWMYQP